MSPEPQNLPATGDFVAVDYLGDRVLGIVLAMPTSGEVTLKIATFDEPKVFGLSSLLPLTEDEKAQIRRMLWPTVSP